MFSISLSLSFLFLYFLFTLPFSGLFEHFLEFHFDFYIVILSAFISIGSLVFILGITLYIHNLAQTQFSSVQSLSHVWIFVTPWTAAHQASVSITNFRSLLKSMSIESVIPSNHFILCHPLLLLHPIFPSIRVFSNESVLCIRQQKYWSFSFSISPSNDYSGHEQYEKAKRIISGNAVILASTIKQNLEKPRRKRAYCSYLYFLFAVYFLPSWYSNIPLFIISFWFWELLVILLQ